MNATPTLDHEAESALAEIAHDFRQEVASLTYEPAELQRRAIEREHRIRAYRYLNNRTKNGMRVCAKEMAAAVARHFEEA